MLCAKFEGSLLTTFKVIVKELYDLLFVFCLCFFLQFQYFGCKVKLKVGNYLAVKLLLKLALVVCCQVVVLALTMFAIQTKVQPVAIGVIDKSGFLWPNERLKQQPHRAATPSESD